jgi:hypothetical protein
MPREALLDKAPECSFVVADLGEIDAAAVPADARDGPGDESGLVMDQIEPLGDHAEAQLLERELRGDRGEHEEQNSEDQKRADGLAPAGAGEYMAKVELFEFRDRWHGGLRQREKQTHSSPDFPRGFEFAPALTSSAPGGSALQGVFPALQMIRKQ